MPTPAVPWGKGEEKREYQGAKAFPEATKDISKRFLQISMYLPPPMVRPHGAPEMVPLPFK